MARSIRISESTARALQTLLEMAGVRSGKHIAALRAALARLDRTPPKKRSVAPLKFFGGTVGLQRGGKARVRGRAAQKHQETASIRERVFARAGWRCEGPLGSEPQSGGRCGNVSTDLSHLFGKGKGRLPQSERTCAAWCRKCHDLFGANNPSAAAWWTFIGTWLEAQGFAFEAGKAGDRAVAVATRAALPASPRTR